MSEQQFGKWSYFTGGAIGGVVFAVLTFSIAFYAWIVPVQDKQSTLITEVSQQRDACIQAQTIEAAMKLQAAKDAESAKQQGITVHLPTTAR